MRTKIDFLFTLSLFSVFAATALATLLIGARIYRSVSAAMEENYNTRTSLSYVAEKLRANDREDGVRIEEDGSRLCLREEEDGSVILTYIYVYDGFLRELTVLDEADFAPADGEPLFEAESFSAAAEGSGLICLSLRQEESGEPLEMSVYLAAAS